MVVLISIENDKNVVTKEDSCDKETTFGFTNLDNNLLITLFSSPTMSWVFTDIRAILKAEKKVMVYSDFQKLRGKLEINITY